MHKTFDIHLQHTCFSPGGLGAVGDGSSTDNLQYTCFSLGGLGAAGDGGSTDNWTASPNQQPQGWSGPAVTHSVGAAAQ